MELKNTEVERRTYEPPPLGNARLSDEPLIVRWDANTTAYTFTPKAGVTLTRIGNEKVKLTTTNPEDKKWEGIYGVYFKKNDYDSFAGFYKENALLCTHSAYTKDCILLCQEGFLPQNIHDLKFEPYQISVSKTHQKGLGEDMLSCDMSREQMIPINVDEINELKDKSSDELFENFTTLMTRPTTNGDMENVLLEMVNKFKKRIPGEYSNSILTNLASNHLSTQLFLRRFATNLAYQLRTDPDFVFKKGTIQSYKVDENNQSIMNNRPDLPSPLFSDGTTNGLALAVNDTWGYDAYIKSFTIDKNTRKFTAVLDIELYDHFGLDPPDICFPKSACTPPESPKKFMVIDNWTTFKWMADGFVSWFILQHDNTRCYKPFVTVMKFEKTISVKY